MVYHNQNRRKSKPKLYKRRWFQILILLLIVPMTIVAFYGVSILKTKHEKAQKFDLAAITKLEVPSRIYDRSGIEIGQIKIEDRRPIKLEKVPYHVIQALTAVEDSRFLEHQGVDFIGIARAIILNIKAKRITQGASTITQQLAKQCYLELKSVRNLDNKIIEAFLANRIEQNFTKSEILEHYLNRIYFGSGYFGIESAARGYFGKSTSEINLLEAATICGLIKNPSRLSPRNNIDKSTKARNHVLNRMQAEGMISEDELTKFKKIPIKLVNSIADQNSYVQEMVRLKVLKIMGLEQAGRGGLKIHTTIDNETQKASIQSLLRNLTKAESHPDFKHLSYSKYQERASVPNSLKLQPTQKSGPDYLQGALIMIENDSGAVIALVGGRNFKHSQFNRAIQSKRPAGTAFKPFVYATAFENGDFFPGSILNDSPIDNRSVAIGGNTGILGEWGSESQTVSYVGNITAREALYNSKNAATVRLGKTIGRKKVADLVKKAGIKSSIDEYDKSFLGSSATSLEELCRAFTIFPNQGQNIESIYLISSIENSNGTAIYKEKKPQKRHVLSSAAAYQVHSCLKESLSNGTGKLAYEKYGLRDKSAAGKTGTAYNFTDQWFIGYNSSVTCGVWAGFDRPKMIYRGAFSKNTVLPIWVDAVNTSLDLFPSKPIEMPDSVTTIEICSKSGLRATDSCYEEIAGEEEGTRKIIRVTYEEIIDKKMSFHKYCQIHSTGLDSIRSPIISNLNSNKPQPIANNSTEAVFLGSPTVLGELDPYASIQPVLRAKPVNDEEKPLKATAVTPKILGDNKSSILIAPPQKIEIPDID